MREREDFWHDLGASNRGACALRIYSVFSGVKAMTTMATGSVVRVTIAVFAVLAAAHTAFMIASPLAGQALAGPRFEVASLKERDRNLPAALREQFGLELKSDTSPVEVLVIDRADKPAPN
jgi:hypothetical protein